MTTRRVDTAIPFVVAGLLVAAASIAVALTVTPAQQVSVLGEQIGVAATAPSLSLSGPGQVDLFGQRLPPLSGRRAGTAPADPGSHHGQPPTGRHISAQ